MCTSVRKASKRFHKLEIAARLRLLRSPGSEALV